MTTAATAAWGADRLVDALQRRGWGELDGAENAGLQRVLNALVSLLPYEAAEGRLTRAQVADAASMSPKWAGHCLARLEALGVITWRRGWLDHGQPRAGWIRIVKIRLAEMVRAVRGYLDDRRARRRAETAHRLAATLHQTTVPPWRARRSPLSCRWELSSPLPTQGRTAHRAPGFHHPPETLPGVDMKPDLSCRVCGRGPDQCAKADSHLPRDMRHTYEARDPNRGRLLAHTTKTEERIPAPFSLRQSTLPTEKRP
jgi:hypothetical protein